MVVRSLLGGHRTSLPGRMEVTSTNGTRVTEPAEVLEHIDHDLIGPVQVVDPQHQRRPLAAQLDDARDGALHHVSPGDDVERVERGLVAEQVQEDLGGAIDLGVARIRHCAG